ncbi:MAG TPA: HAD family phosphatase [Stellaceae bacterium]|nr:HAD family phosphatase [Stellaceae bacterium]
MTKPSVAVFDFGGVLVDWNPRHLYRKLFAGDDAAMEHFLATVCTPEWNLRQDAGRSFAQGNEELARTHPDKRVLIEAWGKRYDETLRGAIDGTVEILADLRERGVPLYGLTNWSAETFPIGKRRFEFFSWFKGIVVSGEEKMVKPDPRIYRVLLERYGFAAHDAVFVDDVQRNADAAAALGFHGIRFTDPPALRRALMTLGLLG